jgi:hypothetical protein
LRFAARARALPQQNHQAVVMSATSSETNKQEDLTSGFGSGRANAKLIESFWDSIWPGLEGQGWRKVSHKLLPPPQSHKEKSFPGPQRMFWLFE